MCLSLFSGYVGAASGTSTYTFKYGQLSYSFAEAAAFLAVGGAATVIWRQHWHCRSAEGDGDDAPVEMAVIQ